MIAGAHKIWQRAATHWRLKTGLTITLSFIFIPIYLFLSHHIWRPTWNPPLTWFDRNIPYQPRWVWVYQSLYLLTGTIPWLATKRREILRYVVAFWIVATVGLLTFLLWPVAAPRPEVISHTSGMALLMVYDGRYGDFPSLHAAFLSLSLAFGFRVMDCRVPLRVVAIMLVWAAAILYATLALKEHYAIDLPAGIAVALAVDWLVWQGVPRLSISTFRNSGAISHRG
jgi:membrane-associated phospholipid phosphatase